MELIEKYFPEFSNSQMKKFQVLEALYIDWNSKINVISRKNMDVFYCNHVLHSLAILKYHNFNEGDVVLDIGTGGGFPGIPLAIALPEVQFTLADSIRKKIKVVEAVSEALELQNLSALQERFENIEGSYNVIVSRAVAPAYKLVSSTESAVASNGIHLLLKGGDLKEEENEIYQNYPTSHWQEYDIKEFFSEPFFETKKVIKLSEIKA